MWGLGIKVSGLRFSGFSGFRVHGLGIIWGIEKGLYIDITHNSGECSCRGYWDMEVSQNGRFWGYLFEEYIRIVLGHEHMELGFGAVEYAPTGSTGPMNASHNWWRVWRGLCKHHSGSRGWGIRFSGFGG